MARRGATKAARATGPTSRPTPLPSALPTPLTSTLNTPASSAYPSTYPSEDEGSKHFVRITNAVAELSIEDAEGNDAAGAQSGGSNKGKRPQRSFPFLALPAELRLKVYGFYFAETLAGKALDLEPGNYKRIHMKLGPLLRSCRTMYAEAAHFFYSSHVFRLFPTHYGRFFKTKKPMLARMLPRQRALLTTLELRVGPGWSKPPRGWVVNPALGLRDCVEVRRLKVFVEFDPSHPAFSGWRKADGFYEGFCRKLLEDVLAEVPSLLEIEFDSYPSVKLSGGLMQALLGTALAHGKHITFGPARGWKSIDDVGDDDTPPPAVIAAAGIELQNPAAPIVVVS